MNQFRPGILQGIFPRSRLLERRRLEITVVALVVSRCAPPLAFACPMPARCASFVAYNGESKYPSLASQPRSGNAGPKLDANVPQLHSPGRPLERDSCLHNERDNMRPFRLATLMAGVVVSVFVSSLAGQRVLANSVVPVTSEAANISSGICYPETSSSASDRSCSTRERSGRDGASARLSHCDRVAGVHHDPARARTCDRAAASGIRQSAGGDHC